MPLGRGRLRGTLSPVIVLTTSSLVCGGGGQPWGSAAPNGASAVPIAAPITTPIAVPIAAPITIPTAAPIVVPIAAPIASPIITPTAAPITAPTDIPVAVPIAAPPPVPTTAPIVTQPPPPAVPPPAPIAAPLALHSPYPPGGSWPTGRSAFPARAPRCGHRCTSGSSPKSTSGTFRPPAPGMGWDGMGWDEAALGRTDGRTDSTASPAPPPGGSAAPQPSQPHTLPLYCFLYVLFQRSHWASSSGSGRSCAAAMGSSSTSSASQCSLGGSGTVGRGAGGV